MVQPESAALKGITYTVFITGIVSTNTTIQAYESVNTNSAFFDISVQASLVKLKNTAPKIDLLISTLIIEPSVTQTYSIGIPYDMQLHDFYVQEVGFSGLEEADYPTWIKFLNVTITSGLKF